MMEQFDLFANIPPEEPSEEWVFEQLKDSLSYVILSNNLSMEKLKLDHRDSYSSVWYSTQMAFRICWRGKHHYFSVANDYADSASTEITQRITKSGRTEGFTNFSFDPTCEGIALFADFLSSVLDQAIDSIVKEFDCCSRYEECSNARKCINPSPDMALVCGYRKIMKQGRIFYGKNRNIG